MTKNNARKSVALGAGLALVGSGLAATAPAYAAAELYIAPNAGTSYNVLATDDFTLKAYGNVDLAITSSTNLKWEIEKAAGQVVSVDDTTSVSSALSAGTDSTNTKAWYSPASVSATAGANVFSLDPTGNSTYKTSEVKVRAYIELDGSNGYTSGDLGSNQVTVKFLGSADVAGAISVNGFFEGATTQTVVATVDGLNYHQANGSNDLTLKVLDNGTAQSEANFTGTDADKTYFYYTYSNTATATDIIGAELYAHEYEGGAAKKLTSASSVGVSTSDVDTLSDMTIARGANIRAGGSDFNDDTTLDADAAQEFIAKEGTTSFTVTAVVKEGSEPVSGAPISVTIAEDGTNGVATGTVIRAGGKSFTGDTWGSGAAKKDLSFSTTSGADGVVSVTVTTDGAALGDAIDITFASGDVSSVTDTIAVDWQANDIAGVYVTSNPNEGVIEKVASSTQNVTVAVLDDFGQNWNDADASYRIVTTLSGSSTASVTARSYSGSPVTIPVSDSATGALTATFTLEQQASDASWATAQDGGSSNVATDTAVFEVKTAAAAPATVTATAYLANGSTAYALTGESVLQLVDYKVTDTNLPNAASAPTTSITNRIKGTVLNSAGAVNDGVPVTISADGVAFRAGTAHGFDSFTVNTDASGAYDFDVYSHSAGVKTFTITSGSASKTVKIDFADAAEGTGTSLTITAPDNIIAGSTLVATALLTDKYGNPVDVGDANTNSSSPDFAFSSDSPGVQVGSNADSTDAAGGAKLQYLLGSNDDSGTITITAKYDKNGDEDYADYGDLVVVKTVTIGEVEEAVVQKVNAGSFKGYVAVYARGYEGQRLSAKIGNDWVIVDPIVNNQENGTLHRTVDFTGAGYDIAVRIYIDRVLMATINLTTK